jgi:hypothetical protein
MTETLYAVLQPHPFYTFPYTLAATILLSASMTLTTLDTSYNRIHALGYFN